MPLTTGTRLGPYEILAPIGAGGMGEVYSARDTRLGREVARKVSKEEFSERFEREARAVATLNHPNICTLFDVGHNYLVMELVEGSTLADRINEGPIPLDEALNIARQIADALEAAHEKGIVHRDLKPGNVKIRPDGSVKVLDFGLAKLGGTPSVVTSDSPTMLSVATQFGMILGTAAYMSPEQARGKAVDKRADIWAFGVVLYEMLTARRPFEGEDLTETLASVVKDKPDFSAAPPKVQRLLRKCLEKDPQKRLRDISGVELLLEEGAPQATTPPQARPASKFAWTAVALMVVVAAGLGFGYSRATRPPALKPLIRLSVDLGPEAERGRRITAILSPDGTRIVFTGKGPGGGQQLFTRRLDQTEATPLAGTLSTSTNPALTPFFSPDGNWIGFFADGKVKKIAAEGGSAISLGDGNTSGGGSWGDDGNIITGILGTTGGLMRMPAAGGVAQPVKGSSIVEAFPQVLPGARAVLFNELGRGINNLDDLDIAVLQFADGSKKTLLHNGYWPRFLPTNPAKPDGTGHLVYMHEGTLFAVGFDPQRLELRGAPVPLLQDIAASPDTNSGGGQFAFSTTGTFVYLSGRPGSDLFPIVWLDATGKTTPLVAQPGAYHTPRLSPDGKRLAYTAAGGKRGDVWVYDLERQTPTQVTFTGPGIHEVAWAPDSRHLVFGDGAALWWIRADGSGQPQRLLDKPTTPRPFSFAPDGRLAFVLGASGLPDIFTLPMDLSDPDHPRPGKPEPFLTEPKVVEVDPAFSPDGKFLAYASNESGAEEVFVRPFPGPGGKWKVSTAGGKFPVWLRTTHELLFLGGDDHIMAVDYTMNGDSFSAGTPRIWSPAQVRRMGTQQNFDVSPDGKRIVMFPRPAAEQTQGSLHAVFLLNFFDEVRRKVPN